MNNRNHKTSLYMVIAILLVSVIGLSIAYAALSTTLNVSFGTVTQSKQTWNVGFVENSSLAGTASGTSDTGRSCGTANVTKNSASIAATQLSKSGDKCVWHLTVQNTGSISATLSSITPTKPTGIECNPATGNKMVCGNITYKLTTDATGTTDLTTGIDLAATTGSLDVYLVAEYTGNGTNTTNADIVQSGAKFDLNFAQK